MDYIVSARAPDIAPATVPHIQNPDGTVSPLSNATPMPVTNAPVGGALTRSSIAMTGASAVLVAADTTRKIVLVSNADGNATAVIDITGGTAAPDTGIPVPGGRTIEITGRPAQSAMTQIGTSGQKLTVYVGS